jgi:hypothetical protein
LLAQHKKQTNIFVGLSIVLNGLGGTIGKNATQLGFLEFPLFIIAAISMIWGCVHYAKGKGYSPYWGALGLLAIIGVIVLALFPDKHKNAA